ncbi:L-aspartate oxidase [Cupriavidus basilensis]|nr:L-aspartate oxidase [Cupriavidus basilensis]
MHRNQALAMPPAALFDVAIVGSGLAGLTAALELAQRYDVALVSKTALTQGASVLAQGGVSAVLDRRDSFADHIGDTLCAGAGLSDEAAARYIVERGPEAVAWLRSHGVDFTPDDHAESGLHLTREGGHSQRRVVHAADATGRAIMEALGAKVRSHRRIKIFEHHFAVDLLTSGVPGSSNHTCVGLHVLDVRTGSTKTIAAASTVLATGGAGHVFLHTTNPASASGDGIAMAWRAGCRVANMEFVQFHPTSLYHPVGDTFLVSEAVRGEGGLLKRVHDGQRFMLAYDPAAELATRDVVARAIEQEMAKYGAKYVYLDIRHRSASFLTSHFPTIFARCKAIGIDITRDPIPVVPAAHYTCGGVLTDLSGRTDLAGLYAVGETGCTGLHGANRLASNSLLECIVIARAAAQKIAEQTTDTLANSTLPQLHCGIRPRPDERLATEFENLSINSTITTLRELMSTHAGIVRSNERLHQAQAEINRMYREHERRRRKAPASSTSLVLRNMIDVAQLIVTSALARHESRGLHFSLDYPFAGAEPAPTVLRP